MASKSLRVGLALIFLHFLSLRMPFFVLRNRRHGNLSTASQAPAISLDTSQVHRNVPLLLALFLATPGMFRGRYWKQLGLALGVLFLWHTGYVSFVLHRLAVQVASAGAPTAGHPAVLGRPAPLIAGHRQLTMPWVDRKAPRAAPTAARCGEVIAATMAARRDASARM